jgi:adenosylcobinamide kinase/adenosylcobinamide-phosphate guanylyltransferase
VSGSVTRTLVLGGARSGKSSEAERIVTRAADAFGGRACYVATGGAREGDAEWADRVRHHRERRPAVWKTIETAASADLAEVLRAADCPVLVDCFTLWLTAAMDEAGAWDDAVWRATGEAVLAERVADLDDAWRSARVPVVGVSNEVGWGIVPEPAAVRRFRDEQGRLNQRLAASAEAVALVVAGIPVRIR